MDQIQFAIAGTTTLNTNPLHTCHVDGRTCEIADAIASPSLLRGSRSAARLHSAFEFVTDVLPCAFCREAEAAVDRLRGVRFGKHERNILQYSPGPTSPSGAILDPDLSTHSDRETYLRAVRKLSRLGLLEVGHRLVRVQTGSRRKDGTAVTRAYMHRTLQQTALGALVVEAYRSEMEAGKAIRWEKQLDGLRQRARSSLNELLVEFGVSLETRVETLALESQAGGVDAKRARETRYLVQPLLDALKSTVRWNDDEVKNQRSRG